MDILGTLVGGQGCAADGTTAARNPLSRLVDTLMEGSAGAQHKGMPRRAAHPQGGEMRAGPRAVGAGGATSTAHAATHVQHMSSLGMVPMGHAAGPGRWIVPGGRGHPGVQNLPQQGERWANEFNNAPQGHHQHHLNNIHQSEFEDAWGAAAQHHQHHNGPQHMTHMAHMAESWANDFHGQMRPGAGQFGPMKMPHPAEMEAAWAAEQHHREMMGPFYGDRTAFGAHPYDQVGKVPVWSDEDAGHTPQDQNSGQNVDTDTNTSTARTPPSPPQTYIHESRPDESREQDGGIRDSARALAAELAWDPYGRFRDSELFRLANGLGSGELRVDGDKVIPAPGAGAGLEEAWRGGVRFESQVEASEAMAAMAGGGMEAAWREGAATAAERDMSEVTQQSRSFSEAWAGLDSGVGAREEASLDQALGDAARDEASLNQAWGDAAKGEVFSTADQEALKARMEAAWEEATQDPDLHAAWDGADNTDEPETLEGVWSRTAAQLESGELDGSGGLTSSNREAPYELNAENRFADLDDPFSEGVRLLEEGQIGDAALCFEAEIARNPENSQAWLLLGQSHAENDQDRLAIACLERAVEQDPYSLDALLALGTSYVNELDSQRALHNLKAWVQHNPKYSGLEITVDEYSDGTLMDEVMQLMLQAQRWDATDADACVVLGVLYNVSRDYDSAAEAFRRAIEARPNDHSLWNKLGATLANHGRSEEALPAYRRAIASKPGYARAWLNMGISQLTALQKRVIDFSTAFTQTRFALLGDCCEVDDLLQYRRQRIQQRANLNRYEEASSCYLQALRLNPEAKHIWSYLRIVFTCMERFDLVQKAGQENAKLFESDFDLALPSRRG